MPSIPGDFARLRLAFRTPETGQTYSTFTRVKLDEDEKICIVCLDEDWTEDTIFYQCMDHTDRECQFPIVSKLQQVELYCAHCFATMVIATFMDNYWSEETQVEWYLAPQKEEV